MGLTVGAALKKIAVALLTDRKVLKTIGMTLLVLAVAVIMPLFAFLALLNGTIELDVGMLQQQIMANLSAEDRAMLEGIESTMEEIRTAFKDAGMPERAGEAQAVYIMALYDHSRQPGVPGEVSAARFQMRSGRRPDLHRHHGCPRLRPDRDLSHRHRQPQHLAETPSRCGAALYFPCKKQEDRP